MQYWRQAEYTVGQNGGNTFGVFFTGDVKIIIYVCVT